MAPNYLILHNTTKLNKISLLTKTYYNNTDRYQLKLSKFTLNFLKNKT